MCLMWSTYHEEGIGQLFGHVKYVRDVQRQGVVMHSTVFRFGSDELSSESRRQPICSSTGRRSES